jgi:hypothetical protein
MAMQRTLLLASRATAKPVKEQNPAKSQTLKTPSHVGCGRFELVPLGVYFALITQWSRRKRWAQNFI